MLAPIRLTNAAAQLVLRTQVRRKEKHPHHPSAPLPISRVGFLEEGPKVRRNRRWSTKGTRKGPHLRSQPPLPLQ